MRYIAARIGLGAALVMSCLTVAGSTASAAPEGTDSLYAPSALVLTIGKGETAADSTVQRAVVLRCTPTAGGDHPAAEQACAELRAANGDFNALGAGNSPRICPKIWDPVVVTAQGVWQGKRVDYEETFGNSCMAGDRGHVFEF
ncbi:subtilase-type protease inhibitor [Wenjunlia tyrosinilytica]|uniref:Probable subtilase-type protease inhibitor n=1 Tax=Wenjunlia tyrosinilytica TaxID=1544741 RepID=A0A917ZN14_9ACTN|nr:subtilase-type protease inhibitor [Wenjunlia tyrosinilytica]GGO87676.1 subtilase-type protease inhibitor [Wenjunlia tyrosinilytica]